MRIAVHTLLPFVSSYYLSLKRKLIKKALFKILNWSKTSTLIKSTLKGARKRPIYEVPLVEERGNQISNKGKLSYQLNGSHQYLYVTLQGNHFIKKSRLQSLFKTGFNESKTLFPKLSSDTREARKLTKT